MTDRLKHLQPISFRAQLAALFLFMAFLLGGMILGFFKYQQDQLLHTSMQRQAEVVARLAVQDVARMVYLDDPDVASDIAERLRGIPEILEAGFFGPDGQQLLRLPPRTSPRGDSIPIDAPITADGVPLGRVHLVFFSPH